MKLNREALRKMILNEIKNLKELNYGPGYTRGPDKIFQLTSADWKEAFRREGIKLPQSAVFLRDHAWGMNYGDGQPYRGHYGLPNHLSKSGYELFGVNSEAKAIDAMNKRLSKERDEEIASTSIDDFDFRF